MKTTKIPKPIMQRIEGVLDPIDYDFKYKIHDTTSDEHRKGFFGKKLVIDLSLCSPDIKILVSKRFLQEVHNRPKGNYTTMRMVLTPKRELIIYEFYGKNKFIRTWIRYANSRMKLFNRFCFLYGHYFNATRVPREKPLDGHYGKLRVHHTVFPESWNGKADFNTMAQHIRVTNNRYFGL